MDQSYFGEWTSAPVPPGFPGCETVRVACSATAGGDSVAVTLTPAAKLLYRLRNSRRLIASTARHVRRYGVTRTMSIIRRESTGMHLRGRTSIACVAGTLANGTRVAGYRYDAPEFIDVLVMRPEQVAPIPEGLANEDACTVLHYALALEARARLGMSRAVTVCGATLACQLLVRRLADDGITARGVGEPGGFSPRADADGVIVVGDARFLPAFDGTGIEPLCLALVADRMDLSSWRRHEGRWIGIPHSSLRNLNVYSRLPMEIDEFISTAGLTHALTDMASRAWRPSELLAPVVAGAAGRIDLTRPSLIRASTSPDLEALRANPHAPARPSAQATGPREQPIRFACIGLGNWSTDTILPFMAKDPAVRLSIGVDHDPMRLERAARLLPFERLAADAHAAIESPDVDAVLIATQHDTHAAFAAAALRAGKMVFVEKPPVLSYDELDEMMQALRAAPHRLLAIGYNRAHWEWNDMLRAELANVGPVSISATVRELEIPRTHPYYWPQLGPRVISNGCHWIDLAHHLLGDREPESVQVIAGTSSPEANNVVLIRYLDGSLVSLTFSDRGDRRPHVHEYIDIKAKGVHFIIDDFQRLLRYDDGWLRTLWSGAAERGWQREITLAVQGMKGGPPPRAYRDVVASAMLVLDARLSFEAGGEKRVFDSARLHAYREALA